MTTATLQSEIDEITKGRERGTLNRFVKLKSGSLTLATAAPPYVDTNALSATAVINTPTEDREFDIIVPMGVQLKNYRENPVVLWDHGLGEVTRPIAKCVTPDGELAIVVTEDEIKATSYFSENIEESMQYFHLIAEKFLKATSVRADPIKTRTHKTESGEVGMILDEWDLVEWSWVAVGCNPDAVAKMLERGTIDGRKLLPSVCKSLSAVAPKPAELFRGITLPKENAVEDPKPEEEVKMDTPDDQKPEGAAAKTDMPVEDEEPVADLERMDEMEGEEVPLRAGEQALASLYSTYRTLKTEIGAAAEMVENTEVLDFVSGKLAEVESALEQIEALDAKSYKGALGKMEESDEESEKLEAVKRMKSWSGRTGNQPRLDYISDKLRMFAAYNNLSKKQRTELNGVRKSIRLIQTEVSAYRPDVSEQQVAELAVEVKQLTEKLRQSYPA